MRVRAQCVSAARRCPRRCHERNYVSQGGVHARHCSEAARADRHVGAAELPIRHGLDERRRDQQRIRRRGGHEHCKRPAHDVGPPPTDDRFRALTEIDETSPRRSLAPRVQGVSLPLQACKGGGARHTLLAAWGNAEVLGRNRRAERDAPQATAHTAPAPRRQGGPPTQLTRDTNETHHPPRSATRPVRPPTTDPFTRQEIDPEERADLLRFRPPPQSMFDAIQTGNLSRVQQLLAAPEFDVNQADDDGDTAVILASKEGHTAIVQLLLAVEGIDVNQADKDGWTALMQASKFGHTAIVQLLLANPGMDVNKANNDGDTALMLASDKGRTAIVELLLAVEGIDVNHADDNGITALLLAVVSNRGYTAIVKLLVAAPGINVNQEINKKGSTVLMLASEQGRENIVQLLLAVEGIDVNKADNDDGDTALSMASFSGETDTVELLLAAPGIDVNQETNNGKTALMGASSHGRTDTVELLLDDPRIDVNQEIDGVTALTLAIKQGYTAIVQLLRNAGAV